MKKKFTFFLFLLLPLAAMAQNVQVHYDFGRHLYDKDLSARPRITTTVEKFAPDRWGVLFSLWIWTIRQAASLRLIGKYPAN